YSADRFITPVIGTVSRDGKYLAAIANDTSLSMSQAWHDCLHNNPIWQPADAPIEQQRWRLGIYALENDPTPLHEHVAADFPKLAAATVQSSEPPAGWKQVQVGGGVLEIAGSAEWLTDLPLGPFVRLGDGTILGVEETQVLLSRDEGKTWEKRPLAAEGQDLKVATERALLRTAQGAIILVFLNMADFEWKWNAEKSLPEPQTRLDVWAVRSVDEGKTWIDAQCIYDGYSGDVHHMIQARSGHIIVPVQELMYEDGRHALRPRFSVDEGHTWQRSNFLDIGGRGHHDGLIEATLAELRDGRIWMLCRTNLGRFWNAWSDNNGEDFRILEPSDIPATSSPGTFLRLASGRLLLAWNRPVRGDGGEAPENVFQGGDNQWSDVRVNNFRAELSVALSEDDGATWTTPVVVARRADEPRASLAYTYLFEVQPGQIWLTTMQGDVRISFHEKDVLQ
ncbi:MAG: exo-alpha-sialidase, partial [Candidatus Hydrogenedentes bacterium]|nr:exo-alpha-sialidase [Candidatus Hydrogenedentota bacterium]